MADGQFEHIETDSVVELQLSVTDSLELGAAADERASDADYGEASDILEDDIGVVVHSTSLPSPLLAKDERSVVCLNELYHNGQIELMLNP